jgi:hypothetical protein
LSLTTRGPASTPDRIFHGILRRRRGTERGLAIAEEVAPAVMTMLREWSLSSRFRPNRVRMRAKHAGEGNVYPPLIFFDREQPKNRPLLSRLPRLRPSMACYNAIIGPRIRHRDMACPMVREPVYTEFRQKVRDQYHDAMAQIDSAIDLIITRSRAQIDRGDEPVSPTDVQNLLEAAVAVYAAKCGPLDRSSVASLILKAINRCLNEVRKSSIREIDEGRRTRNGTLG